MWSDFVLLTVVSHAIIVPAFVLLFLIIFCLLLFLTSCLVDMVRRLADMQNTQFITTTFWEELVKVADKIYGVTHKNRVSHLNAVSKEEALDFIEARPVSES